MSLSKSLATFNDQGLLSTTDLKDVGFIEPRGNPLEDQILHGLGLLDFKEWLIEEQNRRHLQSHLQKKANMPSGTIFY
ncbi:hypothetical protein CMV_010508 [Castanea mollissima]|uniref:Uncharacterized protein n=1 Tax=Castanea mollissima TaxID=60419 RepID=A0A8J4RMT4_9ROSI|nr:hypothetical protein CMV_010508 [Castanea mollissima]